MKRLIVFIAAVIAIVIGIAGLLYFGVVPDFTGLFGKSSPAADGSEKKAEPPPAVRAPDPFFVDVDSLQVPIIRDGEIGTTLFLTFRLETSPKDASQVQMAFPVLNDVYLKALYAMISEQYAAMGQADLDAVKARLLQVTDRVVGDGIVKSVLISEAYER